MDAPLNVSAGVLALSKYCFRYLLTLKRGEPQPDRIRCDACAPAEVWNEHTKERKKKNFKLIISE